MKKLLVIFLILMLVGCDKEEVHYDFEIITIINDEVCIYIDDLERTTCQHYHNLEISTTKGYVYIERIGLNGYYTIYVTKEEYIKIIESLNEREERNG